MSKLRITNFYANFVGSLLSLCWILGVGYFAASFSRCLLDAVSLLVFTLAIAAYLTWQDCRKDREPIIEIKTPVSNMWMATIILMAIFWWGLTSWANKPVFIYNEEIVNKEAKVKIEGALKQLDDVLEEHIENSTDHIAYDLRIKIDGAEWTRKKRQSYGWRAILNRIGF